MNNEQHIPNTDKNFHSEQNTIDTSGLDMALTIDWYTKHQDELIKRTPVAAEESSPFTLEDTSHFHILPEEVSGLLQLFPYKARTRSRLATGSIIGKSTIYFARDATPEKITTTNNPEQALSLTAIIPSYTDNSRWQETGNLSSDIWLFELPSSIPDNVKKIIHAEGLIHEFAHTVTTQAFYTDGVLHLPNKEVISGFDFMIRFAQAAENHPPISHYSSFYRKSGEEFKDSLAIEEEFVETVTARLLGFAYSNDPERRTDPLKDRPEIIEMVENFLNAEESNP
jgi:hypothetical protein